MKMSWRWAGLRARRILVPEARSKPEPWFCRHHDMSPSRMGDEDAGKTLRAAGPPAQPPDEAEEVQQGAADSGEVRGLGRAQEDGGRVCDHARGTGAATLREPPRRSARAGRVAAGSGRRGGGH